MTTKVMPTSQHNSMSTINRHLIMIIISRLETKDPYLVKSNKVLQKLPLIAILVQQSKASSSTFKLDINSLVKRIKPSQETPKTQPKKSPPSTECLVEKENSSEGPSDKVTSENREGSQVVYTSRITAGWQLQ